MFCLIISEQLESILHYLRTRLMETKKSLVIIIDGMERFTDDSSQRLLYNLFDISANAAFSVPICIIGITPCVDILDSFEKRVRSRFSHRQINLIPKIEFPKYQQWALELLSHSKVRNNLRLKQTNTYSILNVFFFILGHSLEWPCSKIT